MDKLLKLEFISTITKQVADVLELNKSQLYILMAVGDAGKEGLRQMELAPIFGGDHGQAQTGKSKVSQAPTLISLAVRGMIKRDLVRQEESANDRRAKILFLTGGGNKLYQEAGKLLDKERKALGKIVGDKKVAQMEDIAAEAAEALGWPA